jgi:hypothetical protein
MKLEQVRRVRPDRKINPVLLLLQDKARPHISLHTEKGIEAVEWSLLPRGPYSPDLAPSDFHYFDPLKDTLRGHRFAKYEELKHGVREELQGRVLRISRKSGNRVLIRKEALWKDDPKFVKEVLMINGHFIINVITFSEKKLEALLQCCPSHLLRLVNFLLYYAKR